MDVLIIEQDCLVAEVWAEALADNGIAITIVASDDEGLAICRPQKPRVVITRINRNRQQDLRGMQVVQAMRRRCPLLGAVYMAAVRPPRLCREILGARERFLTTPVSMRRVVATVRELLAP